MNARAAGLWIAASSNEAELGFQLIQVIYFADDAMTDQAGKHSRVSGLGVLFHADGIEQHFDDVACSRDGVPACLRLQVLG